MININNISFSYSKNSPILEEVTFSFEDNINLIAGPNGSGKTTLLKLLTSIYLPTMGEITINNKDIKEVGSKKEISYAPSDISIHSALKVKDFLQYVASFFYIKKEVATEIKKALKIFEIENIVNKRISSLSLGEKKKVLLTQALLHHSNVYIFDEPLANLEYSDKLKFISIIKDLKKNKKTVIVVSHNINEFAEVASNFILMKKGKLTSFQNITSLLKKYKGGK